jgi:hypothetical protein
MGLLNIKTARLYHKKIGKPQIIVSDGSLNAYFNVTHTKKVFVEILLLLSLMRPYSFCYESTLFT